jgi:methyl-accepting chemotaxis protein
MPSVKHAFAGPLAVIRNLPIAWKLALMLVSGLAMLTGVSWFALDRLIVVGGLQDSVVAQAALGRQMQQGLLAAMELRVVSRELPLQQTIGAVKQVVEGAEKSAASAREWLEQARKSATTEADQKGLTQSLTHLDATAAAVKHAAALRIEMLTVRQKRLFQNRPLFESATKTFAQELSTGSAMLGGADSVRSDGQQAVSNNGNPFYQAFETYRLASARLQAAAVMFMATGNGAAANEVRDSTDEAEKAMGRILSSDTPDVLKASARTVQTIGSGIAQAALDLIERSKQLDAVARDEVEPASQAMQKTIGDLVRSAALRNDRVTEAASEARAGAVHDMLLLVGGIGVVMLMMGTLFAHAIASPLRGLTWVLRTIAEGDTEAEVPNRGRRDEIGQMAVAVETLRGVMRQAFVQSQMIEQIPVPVVTASAGGDCPIGYVNAEAKRMLTLIADHLPVPPDRIVGQSLGIFYADPEAERAILADPARLPHRQRVTIGTETLECTASAILDRHGVYVGPMVVWQILTAQTRLAARFEDSVGAIASAVGDSADAMKRAAVTMTEAVDESGQRLGAVSSASDQASGNVSAAAAGAEELAMSVAEIGRQMEESTRIASQAVREADATDRCVGGLSEAAERIGDVVRLIGDIAARTNLLALNATIEAARAGEAGKGFAVVASEVKTLATQTAKATQEIAAQIDGMRQSTNQAVVALRGIGTTIQRMNDIATAIAGAVEKQGSATKEIARAVQQAAAGTNEVNENIAAVGAAVGNTGTQSGVVLDAATRLSEQSATLKAEVRDFLASMREAA